MDAAVTLQVASQVLVVVTLALALVQTRAIARQTKEIARQSVSAWSALQQSSYLASLQQHTDSRVLFLKDDADLLQWHLAARGYQTSSHDQNLRTLYAIVKFDIHELNFLSHQEHHVDEQYWLAWLSVLRADLAVPEFQATWARAKAFYRAEFVQFVDGLLQDSGCLTLVGPPATAAAVNGVE